jgi:hypothetical protein
MKLLTATILAIILGMHGMASSAEFASSLPSAPGISRVEPSQGLGSVSIRFNQPLADSSLTVSNFKISGLLIKSASFANSAKSIIRLVTSGQVSGNSYTVEISGVKSRTAEGSVIAPNTTVTFVADAVRNGSFENGMTGWAQSGNINIVTHAPYSATAGSRLAVFNSNQATPNGVLTQTFQTTVGQLYSLNFEAGAIGVIAQQKLGVEIFGKYSLVSETVTIAGLGAADTRWLPQSFGFIANSATTTLTFTDKSLTSQNIDLVLDNVRLVRQVQRTLIVNSTPDVGIRVSISPSDIKGMGSGSTILTRQYIKGTIVTMTAPLTVGSKTFQKWRRNGVDFTLDRSTSMAMNFDYTMQAVYGPGQQLITNGGFESSTKSWSKSGNTSVVTGGSYKPYKGKYLIAFNTASSKPGGKISQKLATIPGASYSVKVYSCALSKKAGQQVLGYSVKGSKVIVSKKKTILSTADGKCNWKPLGFTFVADSYLSTLTFQDRSTTTKGIDLLLDEVTVYGPPPTSPKFTNGSFESDLTNWSAVGSLAVTSQAPYFASDGNNLIAFNAANSKPNGSLSRNLITTKGEIYTVMFDLGVLAYNTSSQSMQLEVTGVGNLLSKKITIAGTGSGIRWLPQEFSFVADGRYASLSFSDISKTTENIDMLLDNVRLVSMKAAPWATGASLLSPQAAAPGFSLVQTASKPSAVAELPAPVFSKGADGIKLGIAEAKPGRYRLEFSNDLVHWTLHSQILLTKAGPLEFKDPALAPLGTRFYRIARPLSP